MDEYVTKQKIQQLYNEPQAPEALVDQVILRAQAVTMGVQAQRQLETASAQEMRQLVSRVLIGQLAAVSELPKNAEPEQLAQQLAQQSAFGAALRGGNITARLNSGELLQQLTGQKPAAEQVLSETTAPIKKGPAM